MRRARDLAGQVVVVTGAARGIGALVATRLAANDARVALLGLEPDQLAGVSARCGPHSRWWEVDVTDERALAGVAAAVRDAYGRIDAVERLRPIARTVIDEEFGRAMDRRARVTYDEFIHLLAARDRRAGIIR